MGPNPAFDFAVDSRGPDTATGPSIIGKAALTSMEKSAIHLLVLVAEVTADSAGASWEIESTQRPTCA